MNINSMFLADFYKFGHVFQYPKDTEYVWVNWTPRSTRVAGQEKMVVFSMQYFIKRYLDRHFEQCFFSNPEAFVIREYTEFVRQTLGNKAPNVDHIRALHRLGYLPIKIWAIPEGFSVPLNCPAAIFTNTLPEFYWLPNFLETIFSCISWKPCTSATTAQRMRRMFTYWAKEAGETDLGFVDWMGHDFSFRGMSGLEDAILSGMGHLLSFNGTDTAPAIAAAWEYYGAELNCGGSVNATEHSVMCAGLLENELETFRRLLCDVYPSGILSVVSDTWDLWRVLTDYVPALKNIILSRDGKLVIRPDSGDPANILCGDPKFSGVSHSYPNCREHPASLGVLRLLANTLGTTSNRPGLPLINNAGAIYGDAINYDRANNILERTVRELKLSPFNLVFGIGSYTYEYVTRDTYGLAAKATAVMRSGKLYDIFKNPVTDDGGKRSHCGIPLVYRTQESTEEHPEFFVQQHGKPEDLDNCAFQKVYENGKILYTEKFSTIRERVRSAAE